MSLDAFYETTVKVIKKKILTQIKKNNVLIFRARKAFSGERIRYFAMIYDYEDSMIKNESKRRLERLEIERLAPKYGKVEKKKEGRKVFKVKKLQNKRKEELNL